MLGDAVNAKKASGEARETVEVVDVAQLLARSITPVPAAANGATPAPSSDAGDQQGPAAS
jgi:hypothetical protein